MDYRFTPEEEAFRREVRSFLRAKLPPEISRKVLGGKRLAKDDFVRWQKLLHAQGWGAWGWPAAFGGTGWKAVQQHIFEECIVKLLAPTALVVLVSLRMETLIKIFPSLILPHIS